MSGDYLNSKMRSNLSHMVKILTRILEVLVFNLSNDIGWPAWDFFYFLHFRRPNSAIVPTKSESHESLLPLPFQFIFLELQQIWVTDNVSK